MENTDWQKVVWKIAKVIFWIVVGGSLLSLMAAAFQGMGSFLEGSPAVGWILGIAFWVGVIWYFTKKDNNKES